MNRYCRLRFLRVVRPFRVYFKMKGTHPQYLSWWAGRRRQDNVALWDRGLSLRGKSGRRISCNKKKIISKHWFNIDSLPWETWENAYNVKRMHNLCEFDLARSVFSSFFFLLDGLSQVKSTNFAFRFHGVITYYIISRTFSAQHAHSRCETMAWWHDGNLPSSSSTWKSSRPRCGVTVPITYDSYAEKTNAKDERLIARNFPACGLGEVTQSVETHSRACGCFSQWSRG